MSNGNHPSSVLVTGSTGFLGSRLVKALAQQNYRVRALARKTSRIEHLRELNVEICYGDITNESSLDAAFSGIDVVVHAAADTRGDRIDGLKTTVTGTQNVVMASKKHGIRKLVYISSCSVYGASELAPGQVVDESAPLENLPEKRGLYSEAKLKAEKLLFEFAREENVPFVCLRPGTILGEGCELYTPMMGFSLRNKLFFIIDNGDFVLPLVYIDNLVDAIMGAIRTGSNSGSVYNVVDSDRIAKKEYVDLLLRRLYPGAKFLYVPYSFLYFLVWLQEMLLSKIMNTAPLLTRYRLVSSQRSIVYDSSRIQQELDWKPKTSLRDGIARVVDSELRKNRACDYGRGNLPGLIQT